MVDLHGLSRMPSSLGDYKKLEKGEVYFIEKNTKRQGRRRLGFEYTGKDGFGKWKIMSNESV